MASFDFIEAAAKGYEFSWYERSYLFRAAIPVILVKLVCVLVIHILQIEDQNLLNGLVALPAHVLEAIFIISVIRFIAFREPLFEFSRVIGRGAPPEIDREGKPAMSDESVKSAKATSSGAEMFKAGVAMYLLIRIMQLGFVGVLLDYSKTIDPNVPVPAPEQNIMNAMIFLALTGAVLWAFRLLWLYIPLAMGYTVRGFLVRIKGMMSSFNIFATWFVTYFPLMVLISGIFVLSNFIFLPGTILQGLVNDCIRVFGEMLIVLVQAVAMTFGFIEVLTNHKEKT